MEFFFLGPDNNTVMAVDLDLKGAVSRIGTPKGLFAAQVAFAFLQSRADRDGTPFDVAVAGKHFLVNSVDQPQAPEPINLIINWDVLLKK